MSKSADRESIESLRKVVLTISKERDTLRQQLADAQLPSLAHVQEIYAVNKLQGELASAQQTIEELRADKERLETLALRAYPDLKHSGICSRHLGGGHYECSICYTDWGALLDGHMRVQNELYEQLLKLSGLKDPPNGRIGTNAIIAKLQKALSAKGPDEQS